MACLEIRLRDPYSAGPNWGMSRFASYLPVRELRKYSYPTCTFVILTNPISDLP
jgi:hypothetical protein